MGSAALLAIGLGILFSAALAAAAARPAAIVRWPRTVLLVLLAVTLAAGLALVRLDPPGVSLRIDPSTEPLLPSRDPANAAYRKAVVDFGDDEVFVVAMETEDLFREDRLQHLRRISDRIARLDGVRQVESLVDVTSFRWVPEEQWIEVRPFLEEIPSDPGELGALRERALANPLYRRTLVSPDARTAALNVTFQKMTDAEFIAADLDAAVRRILAEERAPGVRFFVAGRPHVKSQVYHLMLRDLRGLIPASVAAIALVLWLAYGTLRGVAIPIGAALVATLWTFAAFAVLDRPLTLLTSLLGPTLIAIASVYGVHVVGRFEEDAEQAGSAREAASATAQHLRVPVLIAGLTTLVGFAALLITDVPAVFELGAFSALGVVSITLLSITGVPALLALLPLRGRGSPDRHAHRRLRLSGFLQTRLESALAATGRASLRHATAVLAVWSVLTLGSVALLPRIAIDTDYLSYFDREHPVRRDFEAVNRLLAGAVPLYVVLEADGEGGFREPAALRALEAVEARAAALEGVSHTASIAAPVRLLNRALSEDDPAEERIPDERAAVAQLLQLVPKATHVRFATVNHRRANVVVRTGAVGSSALLELAGRLDRAVREVAEPAGLASAVTGNAILLSRSADGIATGQPRSVGLAALTIFAFVLAGLRSLRLALVAMVPNVVPVLLFFGLLGLGLAPLSLPTSLIASVALGIAIDDTVHFLVRYREERERGRSPEEAAEITLASTGRAIAIAGFMLTLGYAVVGLSGFASLREFGLLSAATMWICFLTDLVMLPALLVRLRI
jgi:predicted RND superfamily exporter protein